MKVNQATPTAPKETVLYPNISTKPERLINDKIKANNIFNNNISIKDIKNYH